jgi:hypothetical protein
MMACISQNKSPLFKLIKYKIVVFDEVCILFHFNIILKYNGMSSSKITRQLLFTVIQKLWCPSDPPVLKGLPGH